jgi:hypothetical protein
MTSTQILFTSQELKEFQALYLEAFGESIDLEESSELASAFVSMLYALTTGEALEVWNKNSTLVTSNSNPIDHV